jgi:mono/diheme cytochrome c family protein
MTVSRFQVFSFQGFSGYLLAGFLSLGHLAAAPQQPAQAPAQVSTSAQRALLDKYCATCHSERLKTGGLVLEKLDVTKVGDNAQIWEKVVEKLRGGMMPPPGMPRPDKAALDGLVSWAENELDRAAISNSNPGRIGLHRLNRAEYGNAVRDLLGLDVDPTDLLPADDSSSGFDNIAEALTVSPVLLERYLSAAWKISAVAVGDPNITPTTQTFRVRSDASQDQHIEGLPVGTRGGILVRYNFPLDAEYRFKVKFWSNTVNTVRGLEFPSRVEITVDGARVKLVTIGGEEDANLGNTNPTASAEQISKRVELQIPVKAGPHTVTVAFLQKTTGPTVDILQPFGREKLDPVNTAGIPEVDFLAITGPIKPTGSGDTPSRRKIFTCRPSGNADPVPCATKILTALARQAYRRPVTDSETERLLTYFQRGRNNNGTFDSGIETALAFLLVNPQFLFRSEIDPPGAAPGKPYRISDFELASRLSFFLWSSIPDEQLLTLAGQGKLKDPVVLEQQVRRMLVDKRADALTSNFLGQWLYLRNLKGIAPDQQIFPDFDDNLRQAFQRETELFVGSIMHEDHSVVDLIDADYTFVNDRLARHYGIPNVYGDYFRKVTIPNPARRGLLGQGSVLTVSSYTNRTSPVLRGKWVLTNIMGTPPPPPPPNVPPLKEISSGTMRQRMEEHRANAACGACHKVMDPIGFSLENFDAIGEWRTSDQGAPIDASGVLADGSTINGPSELLKFLTARPEQFVRTMTQMLMTYALGRGTEYYDMPVIRSIERDAAKQNYRFSSLVLGIVKSAPFQMKMAGSVVSEAQPAVRQVAAVTPGAPGR